MTHCWPERNPAGCRILPAFAGSTPDRQRGGKAMPARFRTRWLQARRARSDAPYHGGRTGCWKNAGLHPRRPRRPRRQKSRLTDIGFSPRFICEYGSPCIAILERDAKNPMKRGAQTRSNAWLKRRGTQVWKPAIQHIFIDSDFENFLRGGSEKPRTLLPVLSYTQISRKSAGRVTSQRR